MHFCTDCQRPSSATNSVVPVISAGDLPIPDLFQTFPSEAINRLLFGKQHIEINDVVNALDVDYRNAESTLRETQEQVLTVKKSPKRTFGLLVDVLREQAAQDADSLRQFVLFCTGYNFMPRSEDFKIVVEFNTSKSLAANSLPKSHSCSFTIKFPGTVYDARKEELRANWSPPSSSLRVFKCHSASHKPDGSSFQR